MKQKKKTEWSSLSREEQMLLCIGDIIQVQQLAALNSNRKSYDIKYCSVFMCGIDYIRVQELLVADKEGKDVNLNRTKTRIASK